MDPLPRMLVKLALAAALVLGLGLAFVISPYRQTRHLQGELRQKSQELVQATDLLTQIKDPDQELIRVQEQSQHLDERFPTPESLPLVLQQLGNKAKEQGVEILSMSPLAEETKPATEIAAPKPYEKRKIVMELRSTYPKLGEYLASISRLRTFFTVEGLDLSGGVDGQDELEARLVLAFYETKGQG